MAAPDVPGFRVLGPLEVEGVPAAALARSRRRVLLACLLAQESHWASADVLSDVLWGDDQPRHPAAALHTQVSRLREILRQAGNGARIVPEQRGYRLIVDPSDIDAWRFESLLRQAGSVPAAERAEVYGRALALWRGRALEEIADHPAVQLTATRLEELRLATVEDRAAVLIAAGDLKTATAELSAFAAAHPLRERALELLMTALYQAGRQSEALAVFEDYRARIADELGLDPTPALRALQYDILTQAIPERRPAHRPADLPAVPLSRLVGREAALRRLDRLVREHRLVTLVGAGGVGKTRLALHALPGLADGFPDGIWWCDLSVIDSDVVQAVASVLGVAERSGVPLAARLGEFLADRRCLVVLDNCEHVAEEAARTAELLARSGPAVHAMATGREPLGVDGEHLFTVRPLATDAEEGTPAAVELFLDRARAHDVQLTAEPGVREAVAAICRRLDGLPLAIELAAARTRSLGVEEIRQQLEREGAAFLSNPRRGASGRHRDMWSVVDWSYRLLAPAERALLERLSVFAGTFDRVAARAVCAGGQVRAERLDALLGGLVDKSLVVVGRDGGATRYRLLETVREYGAQRLAPDSARLGRERHARHYIEVVRRADRLLWGPEEPQGRRAIDANLAELRAAHGFLRQAGDTENLLALSAPLTEFVIHRSRSELYRWAEAAVTADFAAAFEDFAATCAQAAYGAWQRGDRARAAELVEHGRRGRGSVGHALHVAGQLELFEGRLEECVRLSRLTREAFAADGLHGWADQCVVVEVLAHAYRGDPEAEALARRFLRRMHEWGAPSMVAWGEFVLGEALQGSDPAEALACLSRAAAAAAPVGSDLLTGISRLSALALHVRHGSLNEALALVPGLLDHWARAGVWHQQWMTLRLLAQAVAAAGTPDPWAAAAILGAHDVSATAGPVYGPDVARLDRARDRLRDTLGEERYAEALAHGAALGDRGVLALARSMFSAEEHAP
ncbi:BTAD domain-containing putative transcriptional regulator [Thermoactinospora rubra]|uniref:BTAD domain-containing putative transcriptional regulator n=1 Tax=Thermoactinospora rubra TaxID=1088767 RepID=UPI001301B58B|nr:BTAD domain-containing putative transcriptional regulator [Thermoactinospora rubra]